MHNVLLANHKVNIVSSLIPIYTCTANKIPDTNILCRIKYKCCYC